MRHNIITLFESNITRIKEILKNYSNKKLLEKKLFPL